MPCATMVHPITLRLKIGSRFAGEPMPKDIAHILTSVPEMTRAVTHLSLIVDRTNMDTLPAVFDIVRCCFNVEQLELDITPTAFDKLAAAGLELKRVHTLRLACSRFRSRQSLCALLAAMPALRVFILAMTGRDYYGHDVFAVSQLQQKLLEYRGQCDVPLFPALLYAGCMVRTVRTLELRLEESTGSIPNLRSLAYLTRLKIEHSNDGIFRLAQSFPAALSACRHLRHLEIDYVHDDDDFLNGFLATFFGALRAVAPQLITLHIICEHGSSGACLSLATHLPPLIEGRLSSLRALTVELRYPHPRDRTNLRMALAGTCSARRVRLVVADIVS